MLYDICELRDLDRSVIEQRFSFGYCFQIQVSQFLQIWITGTTSAHTCYSPMQRSLYIHCANLSSFSIVPVMPLPISAAFLANSDLTPFLAPFSSPFGEPFAARLCVSVSSDCRCAPALADAFFFCACAKTVLNSAVRSCIEVVTIVGSAGEKTQIGRIKRIPA